MADNVTASNGGSAQPQYVFATDDIGSVQYPRFKVTFGVDGVATDVSAGSPLPTTGLTRAELDSSPVFINGAVSALGTFQEDTPHTNQDFGSFMLAVRQDANTASAADGDYTAFHTDAEGRLKVADRDDVVTTFSQAGVIAINTDLLVIDCQGFEAVSIHCTAMGTTGVVTPSWSNTNVTAHFINQSIMTPAGVAAATFNNTGMWVSTKLARFLRLRLTTATTAGTTTINVLGIPRGLNYPVPVQPVSGTVTATVGGATLALPTSVADVASAAITTTTTTAAFTPSSGCAYTIFIPVTVIGGTSPTLDVMVQESDDAGTNWFDVYQFPRITATGAYRSPALKLIGNRVRYVQTITGTTPTFTRAIARLQRQCVVDKTAQLFDRTISLTTLNAVTTSLNTMGISNAQLVINLGAATTPPQIQLEGSDDSANWYALGSPLTGVASSTVQVTVADVSPRFLRARVSVVGATVTAGYILIKGF